MLPVSDLSLTYSLLFFSSHDPPPNALHTLSLHDALPISTGGNLLLNIGPDGRGGLRREDTEALAAIGEWMTLHHGSVQGAGPVDPALGVEAPPGAILTQKGEIGRAHG